MTFNHSPQFFKRVMSALAVVCTVGVVEFASTVRANAQDPDPAIMIVLDGSGSMWGKLGQENETKLALSQQYLLDTLKKPNAKLRLGLTSFGHRRAGNCSDAQVIVAPEQGTAGQIQSYIEKHNPRGKGPMTLALREAAGAMAPDAPGSIILIHDGYDNCRQDPCDVAEEIAASHPKLAIHTISLDLPDNTVNALSCLAKKTGGTIRVARTAATFKTAMDAVQTLAMLRPPELVEKPELEKSKPSADRTAPGEGPPRIHLTAGFKSDPAKPIKNVRWRVRAQQDKKVVLDRRATTLTAKLPAGRYTVSTHAGLSESNLELEVAKKGETKATAVLDAGVITFDVPAQAPEALDNADPVFLTLSKTTDDDQPDPSQPLWIGTPETTRQLIVPTGAYALAIERGEAGKKLNFELNSGERKRIDTSLDGGILVLESKIVTAAPEAGAETPTEGEPPKVSFVLSTDDPSAPGGRREIARSASPKATFQVTPGTVYVEARLGNARQQERFAIGNDKVVRRQFLFQVARVALRATVGSKPLPNNTPVRFKAFLQRAGTRSNVATTSKQSPSLILPAGQYQFEAEVGSGLGGKSESVNVQPGAPVTVSIALNAGQVTLRSSTSELPEAVPRYDIRNKQTGRIVWRGRAGRSKSTLLPPGDYQLNRRGQPPFMQAFTVRQGEETIVSLP